MHALSLQWIRNCHLEVAYVTQNAIVMQPLQARGGWWAMYTRRSGTRLWSRWHYRGGVVCCVVGNVIIASTDAHSGIYAIDLRTGRRLWSRLGYAFDWLLKAVDILPLTNEGDVVWGVHEGLIVTISGRLLNPLDGSVVARCDVNIRNDAAIEDGFTNIYVDGKRLPTWESDNEPQSGMVRNAIHLSKVQEVLWQTKLVCSGDERGFERIRNIDGDLFLVACELPKSLWNNPSQCREPGFGNVPHWIVRMNSEGYRIKEMCPLGCFARGVITWGSRGILAVRLQSDEDIANIFGASLLSVYALDEDCLGVEGAVPPTL